MTVRRPAPLPASHLERRLGDPAAFHAAYLEHHAAVVRTALAVVRDRPLAEDIAQDVFLTLWRRPERFDATRGDLGPYLRLLARSRALDAWRTARCGTRAQERLLERARADRHEAGTTADAVEARTRSTELRAAVRRLPESQREAVALAYWGDMAASEVASRTAVPLGTAKSRVRLGLGRLRSELAAADQATAA